MDKKRYLSPLVQSVSGFETDCKILASSKVDFEVYVDPVDEHYYGSGKEDSDEHLIEF